MAVPVKLREVFPSDSQSNLTEKLNFNFNQLLTLGLGEPGAKGDKGDAGPIGPVGPIGGSGARGSKIFAIQTDTTPVDTQGAAAGSVSGDAFINTKKIFIKGLNGVSTNWDLVVDFQALLTNQSLQDPYKAFQIGLGGGDASSKHAIFLRNNGADLSTTGLVSSHPQYTTQTAFSTQLVLSNFNAFKTYRISGGALSANTDAATTAADDEIFDYTALQKIVAYLPSTLTGYRHQLELGSVDDSGITVGGSTQQYVLTPTDQNLKLKKYRIASTSIADGGYNRAELDLSGAITSTNSINGEILLSVNKKVSTTVNRFELGLTTNPILAIKAPSAQLKTDGLIISRDGTSHVTLGFDSDSATSLRLATSSDITSIKVKDTNLAFSSGNLTISQTDPTKTTGLGTAVVVRNNRLAQGIAFPQVSNLSVDPNTLDDYSEGTWGNTNGSGKVFLWKSGCGSSFCSVPYPMDITSDLGVNTTSVLYTHANSYTKIGNMVTVNFYYELSSWLIINSYHDMLFGPTTTTLFPFESGVLYTVPSWDAEADFLISLPYMIKPGTSVQSIVSTFCNSATFASTVTTATALADPAGGTTYGGGYVKLSVNTNALLDTSPASSSDYAPIVIAGSFSYFTPN